MDDARVVEPDVLERVLNGQEKPGSIDLQLLQRITKNFSKSQIIGSGGCGVVYKGILPNGVVAVKKLLDCHTIDESMFLRETATMQKVEHPNIVHFLGYCSESKDKVVEVNGKPVKAEERQRLLCFEYLRNGSLENYINDELRGLEWQKRYQIIKGICNGLFHLHQKKRILHMDLKPANILLDDQMLPKITDFGLARTLDAVSQTTSAHHMYSPGYCAPEYIVNKSKRSPKADIYSLGVMVLELVTGSRQMPNATKVLRRWRHRWNKSLTHIPLWYLQVKKCLELAVRCQEKNPIKRPLISEIIRELSEMDKWDDDQIKAAIESSLDKIISGLDDMLGIEPLEWKWSLSHDKPLLPCSIELTNNTNDYLAFSIATNSLVRFLIQPDKGIAAPRTKCTVTITLPAEEMSLLHNHCREEIIVQSTKVGGALTTVDITADMFNDEGDNFQEKNDEVDRMVDEVTVVFNMQLLGDEYHQKTNEASHEPNLSAEMGSLGTSSKQKIVIKLGVSGSSKVRSKVMALVASAAGVSSVAIRGDGRDQLEVVGNGIDAVSLVNSLRKKIGAANLVKMEEVKDDKKKEERKLPQELPAAYYYPPPALMQNFEETPTTGCHVM